MLRFLDFDRDLAEACAAEFLASDAGRAALPGGATGRPDFLRLDGAKAPDLDRSVLRMEIGGGSFVLKLNQVPKQAGRIAEEYRALRQAARVFAPHPDLGVIEALYLSPGETFMVTRFHDVPTLLEQMDEGADPLPLCRQAGRWLAVLHGQSPAEEARFWPKWIFARLEELRARGPQAPAADFQPLIRALRRQVEGLRGCPAPRVLCHGDFHAGNLLVEEKRLLGLDLFEEKRKLAVYDMVDFLKGDIRADAPEAEIDAGGVRRQVRAALLQGYGQPVNEDLLSFLLRAQLLIDWLHIDAARHAESPFLQGKYKRLENRLSLAFAAA
ncbi:phosphotransferase [Pseudooceanicola marinus]|uniref:phosphotransferase n=1 Tax=Pseudooceanicola marinus TaxID=396013 RepID=UPI001CD1DEAF|nr:phosphotransferase [Pseudooceanicola marinus]MCA1334699.1 phosphotransferase [Pseudooceanicola marinus]